MDYAQAVEEFATARNKESGKPIANNTRLMKRGDSFAVKLHETDVVLIHPNGRFSLYTGGWKTVTTKDRINRFSPARIYSYKGEWALWPDGFGGEPIGFEEGVVIDAIGAIVRGGGDNLKAKVARRNAMNRKVKKFIKGFAADALSNGLKEPGSGDCFMCQFSKGKDMMGTDHILSHFEENYYVPSLVWTAIQSAGYQDPYFIWGMIKNDLKKSETGWLERVLQAYFKRIKHQLVDASSMSVAA